MVARIDAGDVPDEGSWLIADRQTAGRGRIGRHWQDGAGNFMGTTLVHLRGDDPPAHGLAFVTAISVYRAITSFVSDPDMGALFAVKWPNDVMFGAAKIAGILLERRGSHVVIGIGVNLASAPAVPDRKTASLMDIGVDVARNDFAQNLAEHIAHGINRWRNGAWPDIILGDWMKIAHPLGTPLTLTDGDQAGLTASFDGIERDGRLRLRLADGQSVTVSAGDVQLYQAR